MLTNAFINRAEAPGEADLAAALGAVKAVWDKLIATLTEEHELDAQEWNSSGPKQGWALRLKKQRRNILYLVPSPGAFTVALVLGDKAVKAARQSKLPARVIEILDEAPRYPEGTGLRIDVRGSTMIPAIRRLTAIKLQN